MLVVVSYDVSTDSLEGQRRLRKVAKICENFGIRVQNSVFQCIVDPAQWAQLREQLLGTAELERDSLRFYFLGKNWRNRVEHHGAKAAMDIEAPLIL
jgi:CRISPR-associated protein Cas2